MQFEENTTQSSLRFLVCLAQWILLMPIKSLHNNSLKFKWLSFKTIAALVLTVISLVELILFLNYLLKQEKKFSLTSGFAFYLTVLVYKILFIDIARKWPQLMNKWSEVDFFMENYVIVENYKFKMRLVSFLLFALALGEHLFFTASLEIFLHGLPVLEELHNYFFTIFKFVFIVFPYNIYLAVIVQVLNWLWTIIWNYVDVFLISIFISFAFRLKQIETKVAMLIKYKIQDISHWKETREHFVKLTELCYELENCISLLVLVSFANKLYVILYQLLGILNGERYGDEYNVKMINRLYYTFSFLYILLRLAGVIFFASVVDQKNCDIVRKLFEVSSDVYNIEIERFIISLRVSPPVISGAKLFQIKKSLLLKIASSIIIYELVIIKFQKY